MDGLVWHEWTEDEPPPEEERLIFAHKVNEFWYTGVGWVPSDNLGIARVFGRAWYPPDPEAPNIRGFWARFNLPETIDETG